MSAEINPSIEQLAPEVPEALEPRLAEIVTPEQTGIIVVDVQKSYMEDWPKKIGAGNTRLIETSERIKEFLAEARKHNPATVVFTRMEEDPAVMAGPFQFKMELDDTPPISVKGTEGWEYYGGVHPEEGDFEIDKRTYNSFGDAVEPTPLAEHLKSKGVKSVIVIGAYGSVCVEATVQGALSHRFNAFMPPDLIADLDAPEQGEGVDELPVTIQRVKRIYGYTRPSGAILNSWNEASSGQNAPTEQ